MRGFRQIVSFVLIFQLSFVYLALPARGEAYLTRERRLAVFDEVWQTISERYYDARLRDVDWQKHKEQLRPLASEDLSQAEFYKLLRRMINSLHDSHTRIYSPDERFDWRTPRVISVGVIVREIENELIVVRVEKNSAADRAGIAVGDALTAIDDVPAQTVFAQKIEEQQGASTVGIQRVKAAATIFEGALDAPVKITVQNDKTTKTATLKRELKTIEPRLEISRENNFLIIKFDIFAPEMVRDIFAALRKNQRGLRGVVLDLRTNRGGVAEAAVDIASAFLPAGVNIGKFIDRENRPATESKTRPTAFFAANIVHLEQTPLVVLTGTATASSAEIFAAALQKEKRARIVGAPSCGCVLAVRRQHNLPDGGMLEISELDFRLDNDERLEGRGITPDELIFPTKQNIRRQKDAALERAMALLKTS